MVLVLKNCNLLTELVEGYDKSSADILIEDGKIADIRECGLLSDCEEIDMQGKYILPGLFDLHIHLTLSGGDTLVDNFKTPVQQAYDAVKFAQDSLMAGFTTIRDVGSSNNVAVDLRNSINDGKIMGPNIIASGKILTPTESGNDFFQGLYVEADGAEEMKKAVRSIMKDGADFIKLMGTGAVMNPGGEPGQMICTFEEFKAAVEMAKFKNTYVSVHCHGTQAIKNAIKAGIRTIEHASIMDDECIEMLKDSESYIVPTLNILQGLIKSVPESSTFMMAKAAKVMESVKTGVNKAYKAGLMIGFGTDQGATPLYHGENADEFELRRDILGMKEIDILKQATIYSAIIAGVDDKLGSIKAGKTADLIAVDGNPVEDISLMKKGIVNVIKSGKVVK